ncbi:MAG: hypothetical protein KAR13_10610 [Desulfobulbaceae bacterium]|nr:hypothetical protein [Desulfobulbaceae bacterium]MCK5543927.1 hypothetical protein [Desulfobulbaceae bacterium]
MYEILTGPVLWGTFIIFGVGVVLRVLLYVKGLDWKIDRVTYGVNTSYGVKGAIKSVFSWLIPFGTRNWRANPVMTTAVFVFHFGLLFTPVFLLAHNMMLTERWGFSLWTISESFADYLTIAVLISAVYMVLRRIALPEVRIITTFYDYLILLIAVAPFVTGFMARYQFSDYQFWLLAHIISGEIMLIAIPFTKLSHFVLFFCSRAQLGMDFGIKRGGMKGNKQLTW